MAQHALFKELRPRRPVKVLREFLPGLEAAGLVQRRTHQAQLGHQALPFLRRRGLRLVRRLLFFFGLGARRLDRAQLGL